MDVSGVISTEQMQLILEVSRKLSMTSDLDELLLCIKDHAEQLLDCQRATIWLHDAATDELWTKVASGLSSGQVRIPASTGVAGAAFRACQLLHVSKPYEDPRFNPETDRRTGFRTCNILATRMIDLDGQPVGVLQAINKVDSDFAPSDRDLLQLLAAQAGVAIQRYHLQQQVIESIELRREMELARNVQEAMIPTVMPDVPGLEAAGWSRPASVNGGDCFDLWKLPDGRLGIFLADASGHGIAPALVVMQTRTLVRALSEIESSPVSLMTRVNTRLAADMVPGRFVTAFLAYLCPKTGRLDWMNAGHAPVLVRTAPDRSLESLDAQAPPLGIMPDLLADAAPAVQIEAQGSLIIASDGITESFSPSGELFGMDRLLAALSDANASPKETLSILQRTMHDWQLKDEPNDDQTVVIIRRD